MHFKVCRHFDQLINCKVDCRNNIMLSANGCQSTLISACTIHHCLRSFGSTKETVDCKTMDLKFSHFERWSIGCQICFCLQRYRRVPKFQKWITLPWWPLFNYLPCCIECRHGLAMRILSVHLCICVSVKRVHCDKTEERSVQIFMPYDRSFSQVFWEDERWTGGDPFYLKFWVKHTPLERNCWDSLVAPQL